MSRPQFFIIGSAVIFLLERALPALTSWPLLLFPVFAILFLLTSKNDAGEFVYVIITALIFDFFSGYIFGIFTFAVLAMALGIFLFKTRISVNHNSFFLTFIYSLIFIFMFLALLSIQSSPRILFSTAFIVLIQAAVIVAPFTMLLRKIW